MSEILRGKPEDFEYRSGGVFLVPPPCRLCADLHYAPVMAETADGQRMIYGCKRMFECERMRDYAGNSTGQS